MTKMKKLGLAFLALILWPALLFAGGAWKVEHKWQEKMANGKTYVDGYHEYAQKRAKELYEQGVKLDCADMAITIFVEYAHLQKLEAKFWFPAEKKTVSCKDKQFTGKGFKYFLRWSKMMVGAQNLADNTYAVPIDASKPGDVVLFDWGQTPAYPNFPGRVVWHTYFIGSPGAKVIYYGNMDSNNNPYPVAMADDSVQDRIRNHPDRYGSGARRWSIFIEKSQQPSDNGTTNPHEDPSPEIQPNVKELKGTGEIRARGLNIRKGPGIQYGKIKVLRKGAKVKITGKSGKWYRLDLGNGVTGWAHGDYIDFKPTEGISNRLRELGRSNKERENTRNHEKK
ncbi:MAG: SH3 domain-containing protein [Planctomycetota bacterium]|nr:MAG: SH3 domain-containing protein [Planctomycetota bacterium]